jgi:hypothetical protein
MPLVLVLAEADGRRAVHPTSQIWCVTMSRR